MKEHWVNWRSGPIVNWYLLVCCKTWFTCSVCKWRRLFVLHQLTSSAVYGKPYLLCYTSNNAYQSGSERKIMWEEKSVSWRMMKMFIFVCCNNLAMSDTNCSLSQIYHFALLFAMAITKLWNDIFDRFSAFSIYLSFLLLISFAIEILLGFALFVFGLHSKLQRYNDWCKSL